MDDKFNYNPASSLYNNQFAGEKTVTNGSKIETRIFKENVGKSSSHEPSVPISSERIKYTIVMTNPIRKKIEGFMNANEGLEDVWELKLFKEDIDQYETSLRRDPLIWILNIAAKIFSFIVVEPYSFLKNAKTFYESAKNELVVGDKEILEAFEEVKLAPVEEEQVEEFSSRHPLSKYAGPFVGGEFLGNREHPEEDFLGMELKCKEGDYSGFAPDNIPNGRGRMVFNDGAVYIGPFYNGRPHGENGKLTLPNKIVYQGPFYKGMPDGRDVIVSLPNTFIFKSGFIEGLPHGKASLVYEGKWYEGFFIEGKIIKGKKLAKVLEQLGIMEQLSF